jgi:hypothetical protein
MNDRCLKTKNSIKSVDLRRTELVRNSGYYLTKTNNSVVVITGSYTKSPAKLCWKRKKSPVIIHNCQLIKITLKHTLHTYEGTVFFIVVNPGLRGERLATNHLS